MFRKTLLSLVAALSMGCSGTVVRQNLPDEPPFEESAPYAVQNQPILIGIKDADMLPGFIEILPKSDCTIFNENGEDEGIRSFFVRSKGGKKGMNYVKGKIEEIRNIDNDKISALELAVRVIGLVRKDLSATDGKGFPTFAHEANRDLRYKIGINIPFTNINYIHEIEVKRHADSTQTLDMFLSHESLMYEGDCDDFARSLLASYEIMRDIAKANKEDTFYSKLYAGLQRYKIIGMDIEGHAMNASITYNENFTMASVEPIEPQIYDYSGAKSFIAGDELHLVGGVALLARAYKNPFHERKYLVWRIYDSETCYCFVDLLKVD